MSNAALSVFQVVVSGVLLFFLYRYLLKEIGSKQLGLWSVILASTSVARLSDMGLTAGVVKFVARFRARNEPKSAVDVVETSVLTIGGVMAALLLALYPFITKILAWTIPAELLAQALSILPFALVAFWVSSLAGIFQAALDGCQQAGYRNLVLIFGNIFFFVWVVVFTPKFGLEALAYGQVAQAVLMLVVSWAVLRHFLRTLAVVPLHWSWPLFKEMFSYSVNFQITALAVMLLDPVTKVLTSKFGGLSATAFYEMASQMVTKVRALLVSANQVVVPVVAEMHETDPARVKNIYIWSYKTVFLVSLPVYAGLLLLVPLVSMAWVGHLDGKFILFSVILTLAYFVNNLEVPAHFDNLGTGHLRWNTVAHVTMGMLNVGLGLLLGNLFGAVGVVVGTATSIVIASAMVIFAVNKKYGIAITALVPIEHRFTALVSLFAFLIGLLSVALAVYSDFSVSVTCVIAAIVFSVAFLYSLKNHPWRGDVQRAMTQALQKARGVSQRA